MIDRIVHHGEANTLKGTSYRVRHLAEEQLSSVAAEREGG